MNEINRQTDNIHERILHGEIPIEIESDLIEAFRNLKELLYLSSCSVIIQC